MKILENYIWTYHNGIHQGRSDSVRGRLDNDPKAIYRPSAPEIYFSLSSVNIVTSVSLRESFYFIVYINFHILEPKTNYQLSRLIIGPKTNYRLFKLIIGFGYKEAIDNPLYEVFCIQW